MSNQFLKLRRSAVPGKIPDTGSLNLGEIALNTYDGRAFMKKDGPDGEQIIIIGDTSGSFTGSFSGSFTGSLQGTASWAINALTASTADDFFVRGNITGSNALINGTITAQTLIVQTVSSSIIYSSGSNIFGDELTDTQQFTGSVTITGSLSLNNDPVVTQIPYNTFSSSIQFRATKLESTASILTAASASFAQDSGSNSIRFTDLESTSSALTSASASFSTRVTTLEAASASFATDSGSNSIRITRLENTASVLTSASASLAQDSGSNSIRITNLESTASVLTQASASFSSSIALLSGSFLSFSSSYNTGSFTGSFFGTARLINSQLSGSTQITGSLGVTGSVSISGSIGSIFTANVDTMTFTGSLYQTGSTFLTGTLSVFGGITGSLFGTASWAVSASHAPSALTSSYAITASHALTASSADNFLVRQNITASNALINGTLTATTIVAQYITSSTEYITGSTKFGSELTNTHEFTGSVTITGSLSLNNDPVVTQTPYNTFSSSIQLRATNLESTASILTSASASLAQDSGSNSIRITNLESTASVLTVASASFALVSGSYSSASGSLSIRVTTLENASASFAQDSGSNSIRFTNLESTASVLTQASASFSSSIAYLSSSFIAFSQSYNTGSFTGSFFGQAALTGSFSGSFSGILSGSFSGSVANIDGQTNFIAKFDSPNSIDSSVIFQSASHIAINETSFTANDPEALYVFQTHPTSFNVITGKGNTNNYLQLNIQNTNQGISASSDIVATANNGNESSNYIDMGINSENYTQNFIGGPNDAYLYSIANNLHIGNANNNGTHVALFVGGTDVDANTKLQLNAASKHWMSGSLDITGSLTVTSGITGSLYGTASWAISASHAPNALTSSYAISSSYAVTASYSNTSTTASYAISALSASYAANVGFNYTASFTNQSTWIVNHNLNYRFVIIQAFDNNYNEIIPGNIELTDSNTSTVTFPTLESGHVIVSVGGAAYFTTVSASYAATASYFSGSISNAINADYAITASYALTASYFSGSISNADYATSASFALTASYFSGSITNAVSASYAQTASYLNPIVNSHIVLTRVSQSLNFADDSAAALGGVPLGGLYRNGNFILIRIS